MSAPRRPAIDLLDEVRSGLAGVSLTLPLDGAEEQRELAASAVNFGNALSGLPGRPPLLKAPM